ASGAPTLLSLKVFIRSPCVIKGCVLPASAAHTTTERSGEPVETDPTADHRADLARSGRSLVALLARRWHLLLAVTILFSAAGFLFASLQSTLYSSTATMLLNDPRDSSVFNDNNRFIGDPSRYVRSQARFLTSTEVL